MSGELQPTTPTNENAERPFVLPPEWVAIPVLLSNEQARALLAANGWTVTWTA